MSTNNKKFTKGTGFLLALPFTFALAGMAIAHPGGRGGPGDGPHARKGPPTPEMAAKMQKCRTEHHAKKIAELDTNKDGDISKEERRAGHEARKAARLAKYDKDKSGDLSEDERKEAHHEKSVEVFERLDSNSNAEISKAEAEASCSPVGRHFDRIDADSNGSVTWTEFEATSKKFSKRGRGMKGKRGHRGMKGMKGKRGGPGASSNAQ